MKKLLSVLIFFTFLSSSPFLGQADSSVKSIFGEDRTIEDNDKTKEKNKQYIVTYVSKNAKKSEFEVQKQKMEEKPLVQEVNNGIMNGIILIMTSKYTTKKENI